MQKVKIGLIGLGDMGFLHAQCFSAIDSCEVTAISDISDKAIEKTLKECNGRNIAVYKNYKDLISDANVEAVVLAVPNYLHRQIAVEILDAGKDLFLEKPIALTYKEYCDILEARDRNNKIVQIGLVYRYSNLYNKMAQIVESGAVGNVKFMWCQELRQCFPQLDWFYDQAKCGGTILEKNSHHFDIFNWLVGSRPRRVFAMGGQHVYKNGDECLVDCNYCPEEPKVMNNINTVDHAVISIEYENGAKANLNLCMYLKPQNLMDSGLEIGVIGNNGSQLVANNDRVLKLLGGEDETKITYNVDCNTDRFRSTGHIGSLKERIGFIRCVQERKAPYASLERSLDAMLIAIAAEKSIKEDRIVNISEITDSI